MGRPCESPYDYETALLQETVYLDTDKLNEARTACPPAQPVGIDESAQCRAGRWGGVQFVPVALRRYTLSAALCFTDG